MFEEPAIERRTSRRREAVCPVHTVDENAARVVAGIAALVAAASLWPPAWWLVALLAADFFIRAWIGRTYSPLRWLAKRIGEVADLPVRPVYAPPKQFAARIGSMLTLASVLFHVTGLHLPAGVTAVMLVVAASLEAALGFCLACWLYPLLYRGARAK